MAALLAKLRFLCLQLICWIIDAIPYLIRLVLGRGHGTFRVFATPRLEQLFDLSAVDGAAYVDPACSGHCGTILCAFRPHQPVPYTREVTPGGDGNPMCIDWYLSDSSRAVGCLAVIFPGLASWSGTNYIQRFVHHAHQRGLHCAVVNARGLGDTPLQTPRLMSAVWTSDVRAMVRTGPLSREAIARRCGGPVTAVGVGFSLGGIILAKFVGEECSEGQRPFDAALIVCSPLDAVASNVRMMTPFSRALYQPSMASGLRNHARAHADILDRIPGLAPSVRECFASGRVEEVLRKIHTVEDFDRYITCPANGFATPIEYYTSISPIRWMGRATIPLLCVSALDDPVCGAPPLEDIRAISKVNDNVGIITTPCGGHLGYTCSLVGEWRQQPNIMEMLVCRLCLNLHRAMA